MSYTNAKVPSQKGIRAVQDIQCDFAAISHHLAEAMCLASSINADIQEMSGLPDRFKFDVLDYTEDLPFLYQMWADFQVKFAICLHKGINQEVSHGHDD